MLFFSESALPLAAVRLDDQAYRITTDKDKDDLPLDQSIAAVGLLSPPILQTSGHDSYRVVTGFRRLAAFRRLKIPETSCRLLDKTADTTACLKIAIADNAWQRPLNPGEQARAVYKLSRVIDSPDDLRQTAAGLGLPSTPAALRDLLVIHSLPEIIFDHVAAGGITFSTALLLASMEAPTAVALARLLVDLKLGGNKQRSALTMIEEIAAREDIPPGILLEEIILQGIINDPEADRGLRGDRFFRYLSHRRFPNIFRAEEDFFGKVKALKPGSRAKLSPPADFEGLDYTLQLIFKNRRELDAHQALLQRIANSDLVNRR